MKGKLYISALFVLAVLTGCRKQAVPDVVPLLPEGAPEMVISVKADTPDPKFTFLFWHKEDFDRGLSDANQGIARPYHVSEPTGNIGEYTEPDASTNEPSGEKKDYNTGRVYPDSYGIAVCTGYGPYDGVKPATRTDMPVETTDYSVLNVAEPPGVTDVVVSQNYLEGSSIYPFDGNLEFFHPQIKLTVDAKLAETMAKYIRNVSFSVNGANLLSALSWDVESDCYMPSERSTSSWSSPVMSDYLNKTDVKTLGTVLVVPKESDDNYRMESIDISLSGTIANSGTEEGSLFTMSVTADLSEDGGLTLGDSYEIHLLFDEDQIEITAVKVPWEEGGNVLVPIHPIPAD
ncbi:MAG: hypothetical protein E7124_02640 [Bacteroidales bacterium]|nr:hypothetical protein [Bacteroidales bacterium]